MILPEVSATMTASLQLSRIDCRSSFCSAEDRSASSRDRKSTRLNSSHTVIYTLSLHDALPIYDLTGSIGDDDGVAAAIQNRLQKFLLFGRGPFCFLTRSEEHTSELQSHRDLHSFPTRRSSDL